MARAMARALARTRDRSRLRARARAWECVGSHTFSTRIYACVYNRDPRRCHAAVISGAQSTSYSSWQARR